MAELIGIIVALVIGILSFFFIKTMQGSRYRTRCERWYALLRNLDFSHEEALLEISQERQTELSSNVHNAIIKKFNDVNLLVLFLTTALPKGSVGDNAALRLVNDTTIQNGKVSIASH